MLIDQARVYVKGGDGGNGCVAFRREKFIPKGGPSGGDGGNGGSVIFVGDAGMSTLIDFKYRQHLRAARGGHGEGSNRTGRGGEDLIVPVPVGTIVRDADTGEVIADLAAGGQQATIAKGGRGGKGNARFATPTHRTPRRADPGQPGQECWVELELRMLADVGLIGLPNAGKSTLLGRISSARPKVGDYPFTTTQAVLGAVTLPDGRSFVAADVPGLIEGAHAGAGLGHAFLRHIARTHILLHLIDLAATDDPLAAYAIVRRELELHDAALLARPELVVLTKIDLPEARSRLVATRAAFAARGVRAFGVSAATGEGVNEVLAAGADALETSRRREESPAGAQK